MRDVEFEWDEIKNRQNTAKHGLDFHVAVLVFTDPHRLEKYDLGHNEDEDRWIVIGMVVPSVLVVIYTERQGGEVVRIVSARQANEKERREYYQSQN